MLFIGENKMLGMALMLKEKLISVVIFGSDRDVNVGFRVVRSYKLVSISLSLKLFGRVLDGLGNIIDGGDKIFDSNIMRAVDTKAIGIIPRHSVNEPMLTGLKVIDSLTPIGCGQRQLIIGDRQIGKTTIATDIILNQKFYGNLFCIYVAIGQRQSGVSLLVEALKKEKAFDNTCVFLTSAADPAPLQFLSVYSACALGE